LSLAKGDRIELVERDDDFGDGWFLGRHLANGNTGLFPAGKRNWRCGLWMVLMVCSIHQNADGRIRECAAAEKERWAAEDTPRWQRDSHDRTTAAITIRRSATASERDKHSHQRCVANGTAHFDDVHYASSEERQLLQRGLAGHERDTVRDRRAHE